MRHILSVWMKRKLSLSLSPSLPAVLEPYPFDTLTKRDADASRLSDATKIISLLSDPLCLY